MVKETGAAGGVLIDVTVPARPPIPDRIDDPNIELGYASVTSPESPAIRIEVRLNDVLVDVVWVGIGASHSWWSGAGGGLVPNGSLKPGDHLVVSASGRAALRVDRV